AACRRQDVGGRHPQRDGVCVVVERGEELGKGRKGRIGRKGRRGKTASQSSPSRLSATASAASSAPAAAPCVCGAPVSIAASRHVAAGGRSRQLTAGGPPRGDPRPRDPCRESPQAVYATKWMSLKPAGDRRGGEAYGPKAVSSGAACPDRSERY